MNGSTCQKTIAALPFYIAGEPLQNREEIAGHLAGCPICTEAAEHLGGFVETEPGETEDCLPAALLVKFANNELGYRLSEVVSGHLAGCQSCHSEAESIGEAGQFHQGLRSLVAGHHVLDPIKHWLADLREKLKQPLLRPVPLFLSILIAVVFFAGGASAWFEYFTWKRAHKIFWEPFLDSEKSVNIVFGNPPVWIPLEGPGSSDGLFFPYKERAGGLGLGPEQVSKGLPLSVHDQYVGTGDAEAALNISTMLGILESKLFRQNRVHIYTTARLEKPYRSQGDNYIFIGGPSANRLALQVVAEYFQLDPINGRVKEGYHIYLPREAAIRENAFTWKVEAPGGGIRSVDGKQNYAYQPNKEDFGILISIYDLSLDRKIIWSVGYMGDATLGGIHILTDLSYQSETKQLELLNEAEKETIREARRLGYSIAITEAVVRVPVTRGEDHPVRAEFVPNSFIHIYR